MENKQGPTELSEYDILSDLLGMLSHEGAFKLGMLMQISSRTERRRIAVLEEEIRIARIAFDEVCEELREAQEEQSDGGAV
jgi:hypothetical protein